MPADKKTLRALDKIAKATGPGLLKDGPWTRWHCLAQVRVYIGQGVMGGSWVQCSKRRRPGKKTCYWHRELEGDE